MADRYQDRPIPADDDYGDDQHSPARDSDPLAELARLIGQTDAFAMGRANHPVARSAARDQHPGDQHDEYDDQAAADDAPVSGPPPWMRAARHEPEPPPQDYPSSVHPLQRYAAQHAAAEPEYHPAPPFADAEHEADPSRYDDALYGQLDSSQDPQHEPAYPDDPYGYQDSYDEAAEPAPRKRAGGMTTVAAVLVLAVLGTGAAFAYRTYVGSPRSGEPPIIKADTNPTKVVPTTADNSGKVPDRLAANDGSEKIVPREEAPVDINAAAKGGGPRVVFPPLNQNANPPSAASVAPGSAPPPGSGTLPSNEPKRIKTFSVAGDPASGVAAPATAAPPSAPAKPAPVARAAPAPTAAPRPASPPSSANASANAPLSLSPQAAQTPPAPEPRTRVATTVAPAAQAAPAPAAGGGGGGYLVQISSQRNEADAQASFKAMQGKFPAVLGSRAPLIKRADLGEKGVYYRAMVGPFGSSDEASQFCGSLKSAGGQCVIQRN